MEALLLNTINTQSKMSTVTTYPSAVENQHWFNRKNKRENDQAMYDIILATLSADKKHRGVTLPGEWYWEEKLMERNPLRNWHIFGTNYSGVKDHRIATYTNAVRVNTKLIEEELPSRMYLPYGTSKVPLSKLLGDIRCDGDNKLSFIYADFCGSWCMENERCVNTIFHRKMLKDESILIINKQVKCPRQSAENFQILEAAMNGGGLHDPLFDTVGLEGYNFTTATQGLNKIVATHAQQHGYTTELVHFNTYKGDKKGHQMITFVYKVNTKK